MTLLQFVVFVVAPVVIVYAVWLLAAPCDCDDCQELRELG